MNIALKWWSSGIVCTVVPTSQSHDGDVVKIEGEFYEWTTTPECCAEHGKDGKWALFIHMCVSTVHTLPHTHLKDCKAEWQNRQTLNTPPLLEKPGIFFNYHANPSIGQLSHTRTWHVSVIRWNPGIICTIVPTGLYPGRGRDRWVSLYYPKPRWGLVKIEGKFNDKTTTPECIEDRTLCWACSLTGQTLSPSAWESSLRDYRAWWRWKVSFMYAHNMCPHSTHTLV